MKEVMFIVMLIMLMTGRFASNFPKALQEDEWEPEIVENSGLDTGNSQGEGDYYEDDNGLVIIVPEGESSGGM